MTSTHINFNSLVPTVCEKSLGQCWLSSMDLVIETGTPQFDDNVGLREILGLSVYIQEPSTQDKLITEIGDNQVINRMMMKFSRGIQMPDRPYTYGERIFDLNNVDQFDWMVKRLMKKPECKSATIGLLIPGDDSANLPCLTTLDAKIRNGQLELQFFFRSQNIFGRQYANLLALAKLQSDLADECQVESGPLHGYIASAHIYDFDFPFAKKLISGEKYKISDKYYQSGPEAGRS